MERDSLVVSPVLPDLSMGPRLSTSGACRVNSKERVCPPALEGDGSCQRASAPLTPMRGSLLVSPSDGGASNRSSLLSPGMMTPRSAKLSLTLVASDLINPDADEAIFNHEQTQDALCAVLKHRGVYTDSRAPYVAQGDPPESHERLAVATRILGRLKDRGVHGVRHFRIMLHNMDLHDDGRVMGRTFEGALAHMGVRLRLAEYEQLLTLFGSEGGWSDVADSDQRVVDYVHFLACGCSNWSTQREEVVQEAYASLSDTCAGGVLTIAAIQLQFKPQALTSELVPNMVEHDSAQEFLAQWNASVIGADGLVSWTIFLDYYLDASLWFDNDASFCRYVCNCWGIDMDDWLAKKVFRQFATNEDEPDTLPAKDFIRMLDELDGTITEEEAMAWYEAIDEDDSGDVSLEEFLQSKVLKVKRLFDRFDRGNTRTVREEEMMQILRSLNDVISEEEAQALYEYSDMDGNGEISFNEFLENSLLKMLQIFDEFANDRQRSFNEAQMKQLLRKLDPDLDDYDIQQIYKAIDVDGGGTISFIEFVESHVLRAKILFDRYDIDRSRHLTQFKFRELMFDMDESLTTNEMEAIYTLVADHNTGKVHLGGFLNPNIVRLKLLFDKYDQDRDRELDRDEFGRMLKELYKDTSEREINLLQEELLLSGMAQGITFTVYIQRFKEIQRHHDLMLLAKRRHARQKARSKGLIYRDPSLV